MRRVGTSKTLSHKKRVNLTSLFKSIETRQQKDTANDKFRQLITRIENREYTPREKSNELTWGNIRKEVYSREININKLTTRMLSQVAKEYSIELPKTHGTMKKEIYIDAFISKGLSLSDIVNKIVDIKTNNTDISKPRGFDSESLHLPDDTAT